MITTHGRNNCGDTGCTQGKPHRYVVIGNLLWLRQTSSTGITGCACIYLLPRQKLEWSAFQLFELVILSHKAIDVAISILKPQSKQSEDNLQYVAHQVHPKAIRKNLAVILSLEINKLLPY